jgi:hypothetical protein
MSAVHAAQHVTRVNPPATPTDGARGRENGSHAHLRGGQPTVECCQPVRHRHHHQPHPITGRGVCGVCHPPATMRGVR